MAALDGPKVIAVVGHGTEADMLVAKLASAGVQAMARKDSALENADSAALNVKRRIAADLVGFFGEDVIRRLLDGRRPGWESDLRMSRERHLCHVSGGRKEVEFRKG